MTPKPAIRIACSAALALAAGIALAQTPNPSFNLIGHIERRSPIDLLADSTSNPDAGTTMVWDRT